MKGKRRTIEEKVRILRRADEGGQTILEVCREANISEVTFHRWKKELGMVDLDQAKRLKELEKEPSSSGIDNHEVVARRVVPAGTIKMPGSNGSWLTRPLAWRS